MSSAICVTDFSELYRMYAEEWITPAGRSPPSRGIQLNTSKYGGKKKKKKTLWEAIWWSSCCMCCHLAARAVTTGSLPAVGCWTKKFSTENVAALGRNVFKHLLFVGKLCQRVTGYMWKVKKDTRQTEMCLCSWGRSRDISYKYLLCGADWHSGFPSNE